MSGIPAVELRNVDFSYNGLLVLRDVTFSIPEGDFAGIVGPNGGGKTTLLKLMLGLLKPDHGTVRVLGQKPERVVRRIGYVPQNFQYPTRFPMTVRDVVLLGGLGREGKADVDSLLQTVGLDGLGSRRFDALSGGQQQRALMARALATSPDILMLDEPTAGLDAAGEREIFNLLQELNERITVVLVTHDLGFVSDAVRSVLCVNTEVRRHPTSELGEITGELLETMYGTGMRMVRHDQCWQRGEGCD